MAKIFKHIEFSKKEFIIIIFLSMVLIVGVGLKYVKDNHLNLGPTDVVSLSHTKSSYRIDINRADWHELMLLPEIGKSKAKAIVEYRNDHGGFRSIDELSNINGIGESIVKHIDGMVIIKKE